MKFNIFEWIEKIPSKNLQNKVLDEALEWTIPFNRNLGFRIESLTNCDVVVRSKDKRRRKNHVGGAHACALALLGEYPSGLLIAKNYPIDRYRFIISALNVTYEKQGRGELTSYSQAPKVWPEFKDGEAWIEMETLIKNKDQELVARVQTRWQIKEWSKVRKA